MLTKEENQLITLTGPGTPGGALMRCYWHPIALTDELPPGGAPMRVKILGEELVLFRDEHDRPGLLGLLSRIAAPISATAGSRTAGCVPLSRLALRYQRTCLEQPAEPPESRYKDEIRHLAYPLIERAGLILAYLGRGKPPLLPSYECLWQRQSTGMCKRPSWSAIICRRSRATSIPPTFPTCTGSGSVVASRGKAPSPAATSLLPCFTVRTGGRGSKVSAPISGSATTRFAMPETVRVGCVSTTSSCPTKSAQSAMKEGSVKATRSTGMCR